MFFRKDKYKRHKKYMKHLENNAVGLTKCSRNKKLLKKKKISHMQGENRME